VRQLRMARGRYLPAGELHRGESVAVLGQTVARELFPGLDPVGHVIRIGEWRMRVIGVTAHRGVQLGLDLDDIVSVPVATAMRMLNRTSLFRVLVQLGRTRRSTPLASRSWTCSRAGTASRT